MARVVLVYNRQMPYGDCMDIIYPGTFDPVKDAAKIQEIWVLLCRRFIVSGLHQEPEGYILERNRPCLS